MDKKPAPKPAPIPMSAVKSSQVESIGYAGDTLAVKFKHGGTYHYHGVSRAQYEELIKSDSIGSHLHKHVKPHHKFSRVEK